LDKNLGEEVDLFEKVDQELVEPIKKMPQLAINSPFKRFLAHHLFSRSSKAIPEVKVETIALDNQRIRVFKPSTESKASLFWIHGGGLIIGRPEQDNLLLSQLAKDLSITVFAPSYSLAPKNPYPRGLDDCEKAYDWVLENVSTFDGSKDSIILAGASAGGNLALALALRLRDRNSSPKALALLYPMLDDKTAQNQDLDGTSLVWLNESNRFAWSSYLGYPAGSKEPAGYSVPGRVKELAGLPNTWIGIGTIDLFYQENVDFAGRLLLQGVNTTLKIFEGFPHAAEALVPEASISKRFVLELKDFISNNY
jgi:acetyl esterase/lipase